MAGQEGTTAPDMTAMVLYKCMTDAVLSESLDPASPVLKRLRVGELLECRSTPEKTGPLQRFQVASGADVGWVTLRSTAGKIFVSTVWGESPALSDGQAEPPASTSQEPDAGTPEKQATAQGTPRTRRSRGTTCRCLSVGGDNLQMLVCGSKNVEYRGKKESYWKDKFFPTGQEITRVKMRGGRRLGMPENLEDKVLRKFFVDISDGKVRVPGPVYRDMRCFVHNFLNIIVSQGIDTARRLGCSTLHADLFTDGLV